MTQQTSLKIEGSRVTLGAGKSVHVVDIGQGEPLVYFPGNRSGFEEMYRVLPALTKHHRFVSVDPPGAATAEWPDEPFDFFDDLPGVYNAVLDPMKLGPHIAVGHSMGGMYAFHHARQHPEDVRGLILLEGFTTLEIHMATASPKGGPVNLDPQETKAFRSRMAEHQKWAADRPAFADGFWFSQHQHDARPWVAELDIPILTIIGEFGRSLPSRKRDWQKRLGMDNVKDFEVMLLPDCSHWPMLDHPQAVTRAILEFAAHVRADTRPA